jgi:hypothetical protein
MVSEVVVSAGSKIDLAARGLRMVVSCHCSVTLWRPQSDQPENQVESPVVVDVDR